MFLQGSVLPILLCITYLIAVPPCSARQVMVQHTCNDTNLTPTASGDADCYTLDEALAQLEPNDFLHLLPGNHMLTTFQIINRTRNSSKISNVFIVGDLTNRSSVVISCSEGVGLVFLNVVNLRISGITIQNCGLSIENFREALEIARQKVDIIFAPLDDFSTAFFVCNCWNFFIENVSIQHNIGFGLVGVNLVGDTNFRGIFIHSNFPASCVVSLADYQASGGSGGGMLIIYQDYHPGQEANFLEDIDVSLRFDNAHISNNYACRLDLFAVLYNKLARSISTAPDAETIDFIGAGGLSLFLAQGTYHVYATFQSCIFENNSSTYNGAALEITQFEASNGSHVTIFDSLFLNNGGGLVPKYGHQALDPAGALLLVYYAQIPTQYSSIAAASEFLDHIPSTVSVHGTDFIGNTAINGGGLAVFSFGPSVGFIQDKVTVENCTFVNNSAEHGAAIYATEISYSGFEPGVRIVFQNINVRNNTEMSVSTGIVNINFLDVTFNGTSHFVHNRDTALSLYSSVARMSGTIEFANNIGATGGAVRLLTESYIILSDKVDLTFRENIGLVYGGAIYVDFDTIRFNLYDCFMFINEIDPFCSLFNTCNRPKENEVNIKFINNTAPFGGIIYGSSLSNCPWVNDSEFFFDQDLNGHQKAQLIKQNLEIIRDWIKFYPPIDFASNDSRNIINTVAFDVINDEHRFNPNPPIFYVMPGQQFTVNLSAFDQLLQPVPLTIFSSISPLDGRDFFVEQAFSSIGETDRYLLLGGENFTTVPITVFGQENTSYIVTITSSEAQVAFNITVYLSMCAVGFEFNNNISSPNLTGLRCVCAISKAISTVQCNNDGSLNYPVDDWVGVDENNNYIIYECIFDYCEVNVTHISLNDPDVQCRNQRSGILCGGCKQNYSRIIGGSGCQLCDNHVRLSLIVIFAAFGILLVIVITAFNITITDGYINGFIFYANIISIYIYDLLPLSSRSAVLVAFLNLDFGIQTCFYKGMTELHLVGLELVFPFYLGGILLVITLFAKYCRIRKLHKFLSNIRVTHVFVTLLLLSYSSLIRTCIIILGYISIDSPDRSSSRWRNDPNIFYFQETLHIFLVFVSIILLAFLVPLSLLLLIPRTLLGLPLTKRLKPFIDACIAPFEPNKTFWIGLRLVVRFGLNLVAILGYQGYRLITLAMILTILTFCQAFLKPFKSMSRNIVDLSLLVNLSLVSIFAIYLFPQNLQELENTETLLNVFGSLFGASLVALVLCYIIGTIPYTRRLYEGLKLSVLNGIVSLKKKISDLKISTCMKFMKRKIQHGSNETIGLNVIKDSKQVLTHTSVRLTDSGEMNETAEFTDLRESLLNSNNNVL